MHQSQSKTTTSRSGVQDDERGCPLDEVITTAELARRHSRAPDYEAESRALVALARELAESPESILQKLVDTALALCGAGSAGISIEERGEGSDIFRWHATTGAFAPYRWGTMPRDFSPCGTVLDRNASQLMSDPSLHYRYISHIRPQIVEVLLIPFHRGETPIGTIWVVSHTPEKRFDAEDARLVTSLTQFASAATKALAESKAHRSLAAEVERQARVFDTTLSAITDFAYTFDRDGRFVYVNKALLDLWGMKLEQAVGKNFFDLKYPDDVAAKLQRQIQQVIETRKGLRDETAYTSPTGVVGYYEYIFAPVFAADGTVEAVAGSTRDISERKRLALALDNERAKLADIVERAPAFICTLRGPDHVFEIANERYYAIVGRRDIIGKPLRAALPELAGQGFLEILDNVYRTGEAFAGNELPVLLRRGGDGSLERRFMNFVYQALRDADGTISGIFVHGVDVTALVRSRDAMREGEKRFHILADTMPQMVWVTRPDGYHEYYNRRWYEFTGVAEGSTDGEGWAGLFHPDDQAVAWERWRHCLATGEPYEVEYRLRHRSGEYRWTLGRALPVRNERGEIERWFGTCTDIDALKRLTAEREDLLEREREARAEAEAANRAKDKFLAVLSHELRTPLTPVVMTIPAIEIDPNLPFKFREDLAMVRRNIDLEVKLIDDLLDLSRVSTGKLRLHMQPVRAHELLRHVIQSSAGETAGKRLNIRRELRADDDRLTADPARLQQVFWNLLRNAVKFTPEGGDITVRTWNAEGRLVVEINDTGVGIAPNVLPRVFDAFEQGEQRMTRQFGGLGLGLAIAKAVTDMHGGTIRAASDGPGRGATFTIELATTSEATTTQHPIAAAPTARREPSARTRVLLVEDHPDTANVLARLLNSSGYDVTTAGSVASALQLAAGEKFDLVVSDIGLPDATGYELMEQLKSHYGIKGIALSGYGMEDDMRKSREAGFVDHVVKPINVAQLEETLRRVMNGG